MTVVTTVRRMTIGLVCTALTLTGAATTGTTAAAGHRRQFGDVQRALDTVAGLPGLVGIVGEAYAGGRQTDHGSAGSRLLDGAGGKIPSNAGFRAWSQTKAMTAAVLMQLVGDGLLGLDDTLGETLPVVLEQDLVERADEITIRHLIDMTAGIPEYSGRPELDPFDTTVWHTPADLLEVSRAYPRTGEPGERFVYSNTSYLLLGMIIEDLTGNTLAEEFERRIFTPLGMSRTHLPRRPWEGIRGPHGHGYFPNPDGTLRDADRFNHSTLWAAAGVISTARDMATFYRALTRGELPNPTPGDGPGLCGGTVQAGRGVGPGSMAKTYTAADGRQFAVSATTAVRDPSQAFNDVLDEAAEAVLCPTHQTSSP